MISIERFVEVPLIGMLLLASFVPLAALAWGPARLVRRSLLYGRRHEVAAAVIASAFVIGVIGNQLIDHVIDRFQLDPKYNLPQIVESQGFTIKLSAAEYLVASRNDYARAYFERHRIFMRVERAAATSAAFTFMTSLPYCVWRFRTGARRTVLWLVVCLAVAIACWCAFATESKSFWERVALLATTPEALEHVK